MSKDRKLVSSDGVEVSLFPMDYLQSFQGPGYISRGLPTKDSFSHAYSWAVDNSGETLGRTQFDYVYAPVTMILRKRYENWSEANALIYESKYPVIFPNGEKDYLYLYLCHCEDISRWPKIGDEYPQGSIIYQEGAYGLKDNNAVHVHIEARMKGKATEPSCGRNEAGSWGMVGNQPIQDLFFINGTKILKDVDSVKRVRGFINYTEEKFSAANKADGWHQFNENWYWVESNTMKTGWVQDKGWYFLNEGTHKDYPVGAMLRDKWVAGDGVWYYVQAGGTMVADQTIEIDGKSYHFDQSGKCLNP